MDSELLSTLWGLLLLGAALLPSILQMKKKRDEARRKAGRTRQTVGSDEYARDGSAAETITCTSPEEQYGNEYEDRDDTASRTDAQRKGFTVLEEGRNDDRGFTKLNDRRSENRYPASPISDDHATMQRDRDYTAQDNWATVQPNDRQLTGGEDEDFADTPAMQKPHSVHGNPTRSAIREHRQAALNLGNDRPASTPESGEEELPADFNLRHAMIYSEILKPKFGPQSEN